MAMTINHITLQSLELELGAENALRSCIPVDFYMILSAAGYLGDLSAGEFMRGLNRAELGTDVITAGDWSRPALTRELRHRYGAAIVSWQLGGEANIAAMKSSGYVETDEEIEFFQAQVFGHSVEQLVRAGYPVIVTMKPGFGTSENKNIHAIIIADWKDDVVTVVDPDARNPKTKFSPERVSDYMSPVGGGSIVLPRSS